VIAKDERELVNQELILLDLYERYMKAIHEHKQQLGKLR
jgi:hypothetical protein